MARYAGNKQAKRPIPIRRTGAETNVALLAGKKALEGRATAYVCRNYACQAPTSDPEELRRQLEQQ